MWMDMCVCYTDSLPVTADFCKKENKNSEKIQQLQNLGNTSYFMRVDIYLYDFTGHA